ncbi:MAG: hypothetical protein AAFY76_15845, partial [Cyanobacteria bacterium J06649_11]
MKRINKAYCRFEAFCHHFPQYITTATKEKSLNTPPDEDVYVEYFNDMRSIKTRVLDLYQIWMKRHNFFNGVEGVYYPGFYIFNQYGGWKIIGFCPQGWYLLGNGFSDYVHQYIIALNYDKYSRYIRKIQGRGFDFDVVADNGDYEMNLLSDELMDLELKLFLEGQKVTEE